MRIRVILLSIVRVVGGNCGVSGLLSSRVL